MQFQTFFTLAFLSATAIATPISAPEHSSAFDIPTYKVRSTSSLGSVPVKTRATTILSAISVPAAQYKVRVTNSPAVTLL